MKLRRIFAAIAACAVAATMAISASANGNFTGQVGCDDAVLHGDDGTDYPVVVNGENWMFDLKVLNSLGLADDIDITAIYGFSVTFKEMDLSAGAGGAMIMSTKGNNWNAKEWGNADAEKEITLDDNFTIARVDDEPFFTADDVDPAGDGNYAQFALQSWWGPDPEVVSFSILGKDGTVMKTFDADHKIEVPAAGDDDKPADSTADSATDKPADSTTDKPADDSNKPTGATAGLALAGLALAGAAVVAAKKSK